MAMIAFAQFGVDFHQSILLSSVLQSPDGRTNGTSSGDRICGRALSSNVGHSCTAEASFVDPMWTAYTSNHACPWKADLCRHYSPGKHVLYPGQYGIVGSAAVC